MSLAVCLADDEHDFRRTEGAAVRDDRLRHLAQHVNLLRGQTVGIDAEHGAIEGEKLLAVLLLRQAVLYVADVLQAEQRVHGFQVVEAERKAHRGGCGDGDSQPDAPAREECRDGPGNTAEDVRDARDTHDAPHDMQQQHQQHPSHIRGEDVCRDIL